MRYYLVILVALCVATQSRAANTDQVAPKGAESIGGRLLDDLSPDTPGPITPQQLQQPAAPQTNSFGVSKNPLAQPLAQVRQHMQSAEALLVQPGLDTDNSSARLAGTVQKKVLSDLDQIIAQLSKQCGQCNGGQCNGDKPCDKPGQKPGNKSGMAKGTGKSAAKDSTDRLDRTTAKAVDKSEVDAMVKALWGQLPERSREQMQQSFSDEFLPKYELEIEQYYRRLSEEQTESPPQRP
jgi:hypothetical protein